MSNQGQDSQVPFAFPVGMYGLGDQGIVQQTVNGKQLHESKQPVGKQVERPYQCAGLYCGQQCKKMVKHDGYRCYKIKHDDELMSYRDRRNLTHVNSKNHEPMSTSLTVQRSNFGLMQPNRDLGGISTIDVVNLVQGLQHQLDEQKAELVILKTTQALTLDAVYQEGERTRSAIREVDQKVNQRLGSISALLKSLPTKPIVRD